MDAKHVPEVPEVPEPRRDEMGFRHDSVQGLPDGGRNGAAAAAGVRVLVVGRWQIGSLHAATM